VIGCKWVCDARRSSRISTGFVCLESFIDLVVPILQERGAYKRGYAPGTYWQKLFGCGDRLPDEHPAATLRGRNCR